MLSLFFLQRTPNDFQNRRYVVHHIIVPEPQNAMAECFEIFCSFIIVLHLFQRLAAVQLAISFLRGAHIVPFRGKIYNVITYRMPPAPTAGAVWFGKWTSPIS